jgi:hypothetical protein
MSDLTQPTSPPRGRCPPPSSLPFVAAGAAAPAGAERRYPVGAGPIFTRTGPSPDRNVSLARVMCGSTADA